MNPSSRTRIGTVCLALGVVAAGARLDHAQEVVRVDAGRVEGVRLERESGLRVFRAIPYAAPPLGALRWRPPQPVQPWDGVRAACAGKACPQSPLISFLSGETLPETSEDCLTLDVWSCAIDADEKLPVMVWIHGGGFVGGWGFQKSFDGTALAERGVVFISIGYRLGPLGFFALPELSAESAHGVSGNYALLDQIAALEWVQRNIAAFGGDPACVTVWGESAGATSVMALCASPLARGLFQRAIAQSAWVTPTNFAPLRSAGPGSPASSAEQQGLEFADALLGADATSRLAALRALPADELWRRLGPRFRPVIAIDGWVLAEHPEKAFAAGRQQHVPLLAGTTADEGTVFVDQFPWRTASDYRRGLEERYGPDAPAVLELYPAPADAAVSGALARWITDDWFVRPTRAMLDGTARVSTRAWQYEFTRRSRLLPALGAHHAVELPYVFGTLGEAAREDRELSDAMLDAWVQFARSGDPNVAGGSSWPAYEVWESRYWKCGENAPGSDLHTDACAVLDRAREHAEPRRNDG